LYESLSKSLIDAEELIILTDANCAVTSSELVQQQSLDQILSEAMHLSDSIHSLFNLNLKSLIIRPGVTAFLHLSKIWT